MSGADLAAGGLTVLGGRRLTGLLGPRMGCPALALPVDGPYGASAAEGADLSRHGPSSRVPRHLRDTQNRQAGNCLSTRSTGSRLPAVSPCDAASNDDRRIGGNRQRVRTSNLGRVRLIRAGAAYSHAGLLAETITAGASDRLRKR